LEQNSFIQPFIYTAKPSMIFWQKIRAKSEEKAFKGLITLFTFKAPLMLFKLSKTTQHSQMLKTSIQLPI
jgi:hypothetical protein